MLSRSRIRGSGCFAYFQPPHGWCGKTPYNRAGGCGYLNALILLLRRGAEKALIQWKVVILYLPQLCSDSTLHTAHIKSLQHKSLWILNLFSLSLDAVTEDLAELFAKITQPTQPDNDLLLWVTTLAVHWGGVAQQCERARMNERTQRQKTDFAVWKREKREESERGCINAAILYAGGVRWTKMT